MTEPLSPAALEKLDIPEPRPVGLALALLPVAVLIGLLISNVLLWGDSATLGPNQIALLVGAAVATVVGMLAAGVRFEQIQQGITRSLGSALGAILILLMIGSLSGTWFISGVVPTMIYYGLEILRPEIFLVATVIVCAIVSVATGSSWSTVATVGVALLGIGEALGVSSAYTAGAIISGAYFGDKLSPLSDTTNLAAAMAGTNLFTHVRYMLWTTVPSILITLIIFGVLGLSIGNDFDASRAEQLQQVIGENFVVSPWLLLVPGAVLVLVLMRWDALVALFVGTLLGAGCAVAVQPQIVEQLAVQSRAAEAQLKGEEIVAWTLKDSPTTLDFRSQQALSAEQRLVEFDMAAGGEIQLDADDETGGTAVFVPTEGFVGQARAGVKTTDADGQTRWTNLVIDVDAPNRWIQGYRVAVNAMADETAIETGDEIADKLLKGKGMAGMLSTIWLIVCAMCFGGAMEACGLLQRITAPLIHYAKSTAALIGTTVGSCLFLNLTASDQYLAIVVPGRMFRKTYADRGLAPQNLSRTLEDGGTVTSVLVPWNTCGATQSAVLGISTIAYAPYCFFNWLSPLMSIAVGAAQFQIARLQADSDSQAGEDAQDAAPADSPHA